MLTSSSSIDEIVAAYTDNSLYDVDNSLPQARLFIQACRILLMRRPASINTDGVSTRFNSAAIMADLKRAETFVSAKSGRQGRVRIADISNIGRR